MQIQAFIFDFDGVLVDSERVHWRLYQEVLGPLGLGFTWEEYTAKSIALHDVGCIRAVADERGKALSDSEFARLVARKA
ncbi:MAG: HAD family phosphatase, partial [Chrysiogenetes bacterium]|nr:HAD family phosphatase [Chrysiogenetes bacterium]